MLNGWAKKGFSAPPVRRMSVGEGLILYRCWGGSSSEWGTGYFSLEKPSSVIDAELRFNIVDWGNAVRFVSVFRLKPGFHYYVGPVAHGSRDLSRKGQQVFVEAPVMPKLWLVVSREFLNPDSFVLPRKDRGQVDA